MTAKINLLWLILGLQLVLASAAPYSQKFKRPGGLMEHCISDCDMMSGPVCSIDESGVLRTFENQCMLKLASCDFAATYYVYMKPGRC